VAQGNESNYSFDADAADIARPLPNILELDHAMRNIVSPVCDHQHNLLHLSFDGERWHLVFDAIEDVETPLLIDASGRARASFTVVSQFSGHPLPVDTGPRTGAYVSQAVRGVKLRDGQLGFRIRDSSGLGILLCKEGEDLWRLTLQLPLGRKIPVGSDDVLQLARQLSDERVTSALLNAVPVGGPDPYGAQAAERVATDEASRLPEGWLVVGDALLSTAPSLGWGIAQIVEQVLAIDDGIQQNATTRVLRQSLGILAQQRWTQAMTRDALITLTQ
jgi:hypothetical protein